MKKEKKQEKSKDVSKAPKENKFFKKVGNILRKKWLVNGYKTLLLVVIIVAIYMGVNILLGKVTLPEIDCTSEKIYSISDETKDKIGKIEQEVTITLINYGENSSIINFIEKYEGVNKNIKIERVDDLSARSDIMTKYSLESTDNLIVVASGESEKTLTQYDLRTYDSSYETIDITEEAITNAILDVSTTEKPKVYFSSTHLAYDLQYYTTIIKSMENEANEVKNVNILANGGVPEDCDVLVLTTVKEDITELERDKIIEYIKNGGEILLMCGPNIGNVELTNFQKVLDEYGITISNGVIFEGESSKMFSGYPDIIIADTLTTKLTEKLNMKTSLNFIDAGSLKFAEEKLEELGVTYEPLANTSTKAFLRTNLNLKSVSRTAEDSEEAEYMVAAIATKTIGEDKTSKLVVFADELFAMDTPIQMDQYTIKIVDIPNNEDLILNSLSYLNERENTITIRKTADNVKYTVTEQQHNLIFIIIFAVPIVIIILGIVVWQLRRRKK